jgi:hypothetical protein
MRNFQNRSPKPSETSGPGGTAEFIQSRIDYEPPAEEVARRAYFTYVNEGSLPGRDVQHWLEAEAHLLAERNLTRVHGFHNKT